LDRFVDAKGSKSRKTDHYWKHLIKEGGTEVACGWLTDKFGISWQIIPKKLSALVGNPEKPQG
jgi:predicted 3-demethylubiquinone-9 3-methyltransferase (glyoxalase superfamily)